MFQAVDLNKPVDKKLYKGTNPTCHNFNQTTATADSAPLLVGFSTGQIQLIDPIKKDSSQLSKLYNEDVCKSKFGMKFLLTSFYQLREPQGKLLICICIC